MDNDKYIKLANVLLNTNDINEFTDVLKFICKSEYDDGYYEGYDVGVCDVLNELYTHYSTFYLHKVKL